MIQTKIIEEKSKKKLCFHCMENESKKEFYAEVDIKTIPHYSVLELLEKNLVSYDLKGPFYFCSQKHLDEWIGEIIKRLVESEK